MPVTSIKVEKKPLSKPNTTYAGRTAIVKRGDNLYSISFLAGFNPSDVAAWNEMELEAIIHLGQKIKLYPLKKSTVTRTRTNVGTNNGSTSTNIGSTSKREQQTPTVTSAKVNQPKSENIAAQPTVPKSTPGVATNWQWPAQGKLISTFSKQQRRNGIEIAGEIGTPINVASNGRVVYAGSGLIGYGRIIIVKHDVRFLSVYAHNSRLVANEGDQVKKGQKIAEMGNTDADRVKLHFEIRLDGKPVNPLRYLPKA